MAIKVPLSCYDKKEKYWLKCSTKITEDDRRYTLGSIKDEFV